MATFYFDGRGFGYRVTRGQWFQIWKGRMMIGGPTIWRSHPVARYEVSLSEGSKTKMEQTAALDGDFALSGDKIVPYEAPRWWN